MEMDQILGVEAVLRFAFYERDFIMIIKIFTFAPLT